MLSFASFIPAHPVILPSVGKEHHDTLKTTFSALKTIATELRKSRSDSVLLISYPKKIPHVFGMQFAQEMKGNLKDFGDFSTTATYPCDYVLGYELKASVHDAFPVHADGNSQLPYTATVPLLLLEVAPVCPIFLIEVCAKSFAQHHALGKALSHAIRAHTKRIAVIATGDLSHDPNGEEFDRNIVKLVQERNNAFLNENEQLTPSFHETALKSLAVLMGLMESAHAAPKILSYERPLGVGHMVLQYPV